MKLADLSIRYPVFAVVINIVLVVAGAVAYRHIGVDLFPNVDIPVVTVTTVYPGADPSAVETQISAPLEEALNSLSGLKTLRSVSLESVSQIIMEFELDRDGDEAATDVRDKVAATQRDLPQGVEPALVQKFDVGAAPILSIALSGARPLRALTQIAEEDIKARLQQISGVGEVEIVGGRQREVQVQVRREALKRYGLTVSDVAQAVRAQNIEIPGGRLEIGGVEYAVKTKGEVSGVAALGDIVLLNMNKRAVRLSDVAEVIDGEEEARSASNQDGRAAVSLLIIKQSGSNTVEVAHRVKAALAEIARGLPGDLQISTPIDNSVFIEASINDVQFDLLFGAVLAVLIIFFFLRDPRATLISALALPTSVIATVAFIHFMGFSFNTMTMLALTLSIGILIDDAIVVIENIHRHIEMGKAPMSAASEATAEIGLAVMAITAAIIAVFVPVATMKGIVGRFFFEFGLTVSFAVAVSLFTSLTLTPMLASRLLKPGHAQPGRLSRIIGGALDLVDRLYRRQITAALNHRLITLMVAAVAFGASLYLLRFISVEFIPPEDRGEFSVEFELPSGAPLAETLRFGEGLRGVIKAIPGVEMTFTRVGGGARGQVNQGSMHVELVDKAHRGFDTEAAIRYTRHKIGDRRPAKITVQKIDDIGGAGEKTIQYNLRGADLAALSQAAAALVEALTAAGGFVDLDTTLSEGKPELNITINREAAADVGAPVAQIAMTIRALINGEEISEVPIDGERLSVRLRQHPDERRQLNDLEAIQVRSRTSELVDLRGFVRVTEGRGPAQIDRQAQTRQITVRANLDGRALGDGMAEVERLAEAVVPAHITRGFGGRSKTMQETSGYMIEALILAMI
ncbi:efflux RND transporter permease subunit, partial [Myxococcota bacterium]|nr:efflux RND transporter permease subunit [Myxococcota bacterium]